MGEALIREFQKVVATHLAEAKAGHARAAATIADAHEWAVHLGGLSQGLTYAWRSLACECADATAADHAAKLDTEVGYDVNDLEIGRIWLPRIRRALAGDIPVGAWTGTVAPSDGDFADDWLKQHETKGEKYNDDLQWTSSLQFEYFHMSRNFDISLAMIDALLSGHTTEWQLVMLGCGPLEDLLGNFGERAVDAIVPRLKNEPALAKAVACVWINPGEKAGRKIRDYWSLKIAAHGVPVACSGGMHLPGPHPPF